MEPDRGESPMASSRNYIITTSGAAAGLFSQMLFFPLISIYIKMNDCLVNLNLVA